VSLFFADFFCISGCSFDEGEKFDFIQSLNSCFSVLYIPSNSKKAPHLQPNPPNHLSVIGKRGSLDSSRKTEIIVNESLLHKSKILSEIEEQFPPLFNDD